MYSATTVIYPYCHTLSLHDALPISVDRVVELDGRIRTIAASCGEVQAGRGAMLLSTSIPETMDAVEGRIDAAVRRLAYKGGSIARTRLNGGFKDRKSVV